MLLTTATQLWQYNIIRMITRKLDSQKLVETETIKIGRPAETGQIKFYTVLRKGHGDHCKFGDRSQICKFLVRQ